jgi:hypothetical protein
MTAKVIPFVPKPKPLSTEERLRIACARLGITADDMPSEAGRRPRQPEMVTIQMDAKEAAALRRFATAFFAADRQPDPKKERFKKKPTRNDA